MCLILICSEIKVNNNSPLSDKKFTISFNILTMNTKFSEKIIKKFNFGEKNLRAYEKIIENYKNSIECKGVYCEDFSELKKTISFFITTSSEKEAFYRRLIHDIKSPILSIELAIRNSGGDYPINDIYNINSSILELINNTLILQVEKDKKEEIKPLNIIESVIALHKFLIEDKKLEFDVNIKDNFKVKICPCYMERIFSNLIYNAIKYSPIGSKIQVFQKNKNTLCFKNNIENDFTIKGHGLGLKIVKELCKKSKIHFSKRKFLNTITFSLKFQNMF